MDPNAPQWWATPFLTGALGVVAAYFGIKFDLRKSANQELIKKRLVVYDQTAPRLNEILCFYFCIGSWRSLDPQKILDNKRSLDRDMNIYAALFSSRFIRKYNEFITVCFRISRGYGEHAILRADLYFLSQNWGKEWKSEWDEYFDQHAPFDLHKVQAAYNSLMDAFGAEVGINRWNLIRSLRSRLTRRLRVHLVRPHPAWYETPEP
jgi:hypothetical protein